jgi:polar amino acid transport system substrate-binding protein
MFCLKSQDTNGATRNAHTRNLRAMMILVAATTSLGSSAMAADDTLQQMLPDAIRKAGELHVAANAAYPPFNYKNEAGESAGLEASLLRAMGEKLGIKLKFTAIDFPSILPGVTAGRFDVGAAGFSNTEERRKVVEFVNYAYTVDGIVVPKGNPGKVSIADPCGKTISVSQGSYQQVNLAALSAQCVAQGKAAIEMPPFQGTPPQVVALKSGRVQASNIDKAVATYLVKKDPENLEAVAGVVPNAGGNKLLMGIIMRKGDIELAKALQAGLNAVIKDGSYAKILKEWEIVDEAKIAESTIN